MSKKRARSASPAPPPYEIKPICTTLGPTESTTVFNLVLPDPFPQEKELRFEFEIFDERQSIFTSQCYSFCGKGASITLPPSIWTRTKLSISVMPNNEPVVEYGSDFPVKDMGLATSPIRNALEFDHLMPVSLIGKDVLFICNLTYYFDDRAVPCKWVIPWHWPANKSNIRLYSFLFY